MFCRACHYQLNGLPEPRCPECGRAFDPADPATFTLDPRRLALWRRLRRIALAVSTVFLAAAMLGAWFYIGYHEEQRILSDLGADVWDRSSVLPARLNQWLTRVGFPCFTRVTSIVVQNQGTTDNDLRQVARLRRLTSLHVSSNNITHEGLESLAGLHKLKSLTLWGNSLTDEGVNRLKAMSKLEHLSLMYVPLTDEGFRELASLQNLSALTIESMSVSQVALNHLKTLPQLRHLQLNYCRITPEAAVSLGTWDHLETLCFADITPCSTVREFKRMKSLRFLNIVGSNCEPGSWQVIQEFKKARPDVFFHDP